MSKKAEHASTPATLALTRAGVAFDAHSYVHDPAAPSFGLEAAEALGVEPAVVFKTLLVDTGDSGAGSALAVGIVPVAASLDLKRLATALGTKRVAMADPAMAERVTGYVVGGISPLGQKRQLPTVLDKSALAFERIYVSGGRRGFDVSLAPGDLLALTRGLTAPISRPAPSP